MSNFIVKQDILMEFGEKRVSEFKLVDDANDLKAMAAVVEREKEIRIVSVITVFEQRRKGMCGLLMRFLIQALDSQRKPLYLEADQFDEDGLNDTELHAFYAKFGFVDVPGHPFAMVRFPIAKTPSVTDN